MTVGRGSRIGIWLIGLVASFLVVRNAQFSADLSTFLPRDPSPAQQILVEQLRDGSVSRLLLVALEGAPSPVVAAVSKDLAARLRKEDSFAAVNNGERTGFDRDGDFVWRHRYLLSDGVKPERFTPAGLHDALNDDLDQLGSAASALVKRTLPDDPTGEALHLFDEFAGDVRPTTNDGVWFSSNGARALLLIQTKASGFEADAQQIGLTRLDADFAVAKAQIDGAANVRLLVTGPGVFTVNTRDTIKQDASRLSLLAILGVAALLLLVYRSSRVLVLALLPMASGALVGLAAVSLGFGSVHGITLGFGVTLIGEAVDYAIYLFTQTSPGTPPEQTLPRIWPTLRLGVLTSLCGFSAMLLSSFQGLAQLGLFSIVGLVVAVSVTRWILPLLLPRDFSTPVSRIFAPSLLRLVHRAGILRYPLLIAVLAAVGLIGVRHNNIWDDELASLSPVPRAAQLLDQQLRKDIGAPDLRYLLVVTAPSADRALTESEVAGTWLQGLADQNLIGGFDSPARYLPSQETQRMRQAALPDPAVLRANLHQALDGMPFRPELFEPFLKDVEAARTQPLLDRASLANTSFDLKIDSLLLPHGDGWAGLLPLHDVADPARLAAAVADHGQAGLILLDLKGDSDLLYRSYRRQAVNLALIGTVAIAILLFPSLRSPRRVYEVMGPLAAAVIVTAAFLVASGQKLSIFHLVGLLLVVGVGSNYALFFERQNAADETGAIEHRQRLTASLVLANLCTVIGFGVLGFSRIPVLNGIGTTVAVGAMLSLVFAAILSVRPIPR